MKCPKETGEGRDSLLALAAGKLEPALEDHIRACPACADLVRGQRAVWDALDAWTPPPVAADFDRRLYRRIESRGSWWELLLRPLGSGLIRQGLPVVAAAGLVVAAGLLLGRPGAPPPASSSQSAKVESMQPDQVEHALEEMEMLSEFQRRLGASDPRI